MSSHAEIVEQPVRLEPEPEHEFVPLPQPGSLDKATHLDIPEPEMELECASSPKPRRPEAFPVTSTMVLRSRSSSHEHEQKPSCQHMAKAVIKLTRLDINSTKPVKVTTKLLQSLPKSKYMDKPKEVSSDDTEFYWPLDKSSDEQSPKRPVSCITHAHPSKQMANFSFSLHGIRCVRPQYNLYCLAKIARRNSPQLRHGIATISYTIVYL